MTVKKTYPVLCAWCGKLTGFTGIEHSHSICQECADKLLAPIKEKAKS